MGKVKGSQNTSVGEAALSKSASDLDNANYTLTLEEVEYDEKCLEVYLSKLSNFEVRVRQLNAGSALTMMRAITDSAIRWRESMKCRNVVTRLLVGLLVLWKRFPI